MKYKTEQIQIRIESDLKEKAKELAEKQGDNLSRYIIKLIKSDLEKPVTTWIDPDGCHDYVCSHCGTEAPNDGYDNGAKYCYNCGYKMLI